MDTAESINKSIIHHAVEDADALIVSAASSSFDSRFIVREYIDLLVLLVALANNHPNV